LHQLKEISQLSNHIALVTPLRNEIENIPKLISSIESQTIKIYLWLILENDSNDGSVIYLSKVKKLKNVDNFIVKHISFSNKEHQLGIKYSKIIKYGFHFIQKSQYYKYLDFIGILDSDCIPASDYYEKIIGHFNSDSSLGIASGVIKYSDCSIENSNYDHARGGCRIWHIECFKTCPYEVGISADSISEAKAILSGWSVKSFSDAIVTSRKVGSRYINKYSGISAYYNWIPMYYILFKSFYYILKGNFRYSWGLFYGYIWSIFHQKERLNNKKIKEYYRSIFFRKVRGALKKC
jgi:glycosyltransferase involved in cell wall biosynthesis